MYIVNQNNIKIQESKIHTCFNVKFLQNFRLHIFPTFDPSIDDEKSMPHYFYYWFSTMKNYELNDKTLTYFNNH